MPVSLKQLLEKVDPTGQDKVQKVRDEHGRLLREAVKAETRLSLRVNSLSAGVEQAQVPIAIVPGMPDSRARLVFSDDLLTAARLLPHRRALVDMCRGASDLERANDILEGIPSYEKLSFPNSAVMEKLGAWAGEVVRFMDANDPLSTILNVHEDVLGVYRYSALETDPREASPARIELYWSVITFFAEALGSEIADLTVVVLVHEVAHAYVHQGADSNGLRWAAAVHADVEPELVEALAQFFTHGVIQRLSARFPGAVAAYERLLPRQPEMYRYHLEWIEAGISPEAVRRALLDIRRSGGRTLGDFTELLTAAHSALS